MSSYAHPESLATTQCMVDHLSDPKVKVVEVIWGLSPGFGRPAYEKAHIPGAVAWDFEKDNQNGKADFLNKTGFENLMSRSSIKPESPVVIYSGMNNLLATYAFWQMKIYGHVDVRLLDKDRQRWMDENLPASGDAPKTTPTIYQAREPDWRIRANREEVLHSVDKVGHLFVDTRTVEMYQGLDKSSGARGGHIPGAVNLPARREMNADGSFKAWRVQTVRPDGTFKSAEELKALVNTTGITPDKEITLYCVRGGLSTHAWFVLTQLLGYSKVREYDRSWLEWGNTEGMPIEL